MPVPLFVDTKANAVRPPFPTFMLIPVSIDWPEEPAKQKLLKNLLTPRRLSLGGLTYRGKLSKVDLNDYTDDGIYKIVENCDNLPTGFSTWGEQPMIVLSTTDKTQIKQIYLNIRTGQTVSRYKSYESSYVWTNWIEEYPSYLAGTTLSSLASALGVNSTHRIFESAIIKVCNFQIAYGGIGLCVSAYNAGGVSSNNIGMAYIIRQGTSTNLSRSGDSFNHVKFYQDSSLNLYIKATMTTGRLLISEILNDSVTLSYEEVSIDISTLTEI